MRVREAAVFNSDEEEISTLMDILRETAQRLEELTSGEVDTATDPEGRTLLFRGTREQLQQNEMARQAAILNALPAHIALLDPDGTIVSVNDGWRRFADANSMSFPNQGLGINYLAVCDSATGRGSQDARLAAEGIRSVLNGPRQSFCFDYECEAPSEKLWYELTVTPLSSDAPKGVIVKHGNISAQKRDRSDLVSLAERLSLAAEIARVGVWEWDMATNVLEWDETMYSIYGLPPAGPMSYEKWAAAVYPEDLPEVEAKLQRAIHQGSEERAEFRITAGDGTTRYVSAAERTVVDHSGAVCRMIGVNVDVTERKRADEESRRNQAIMTHLAEHDALTGLPNQRLLRDRIDRAIKLAERNQQNVAVLFLDLDGFKHINDSLGHAVGDKLLQSAARRLEQALRTSDTLSRFGGDEFIVLLPVAHHPYGTAVAAAGLLDAVSGIHSAGEHELHVSACAGVSVYPDDGLDGETLIKNADTAMYHAKGKGGSSFAFFHPDMNIRAIERQFIEQNLRRAVNRNELALHYQPKYDLKSRAITGVEALLRWNHPVRGPISPATFIPVAEDCGLILPIGAWVLEETCRQARAWLDAGLPRISVAVNVSGRQFQSESFEEKVLSTLEQFRIEPEYLELEVTESLLMRTPELTASLLQGLRRKGVRVAIDDFGTGYSSLSYLHRFPIDTLKIDQSFVRKIDTPDGLSMIRAIIDMGRNLGLRTIAEGVETAQEATILESMGCDRAQGYYFSRPLTPAKLASLFDHVPGAEPLTRYSERTAVPHVA
jgi:diguanylate cyclase (GGDEF)-like protein/PAS domain S-box-containing protein